MISISNNLANQHEKLEKQGIEQRIFWDNNSTKLSSLVERSDKSSRKLSEILYPLEKISFSYSLIYKNASTSFPNYFNRLKTEFEKGFEGEGVLFIQKEISDNGHDLIVLEPVANLYPISEEENAYYEFMRADDVVVLYQTNNQLSAKRNLIRKKKIDFSFKLNEQLNEHDIEKLRIKPTSGTKTEELFIDLTNNTIVHHISNAKAKLTIDSGEKTSILDLTEPISEEYLYFEFRVQSYVKNSDVESFHIHFGDSYQNTIELNTRNLKKFKRHHFFGTSDLSYYGSLKQLLLK
jgi:hypothetical protein